MRLSMLAIVAILLTACGTAPSAQMAPSSADTRAVQSISTAVRGGSDIQSSERGKQVRVTIRLVLHGDVPPTEAFGLSGYECPPSGGCYGNDGYEHRFCESEYTDTHVDPSYAPYQLPNWCRGSGKVYTYSVPVLAGSIVQYTVFQQSHSPRGRVLDGKSLLEVKDTVTDDVTYSASDSYPDVLTKEQEESLVKVKFELIVEGHQPETDSFELLLDAKPPRGWPVPIPDKSFTMCSALLPDRHLPKTEDSDKCKNFEMFGKTHTVYAHTVTYPAGTVLSYKFVWNRYLNESDRKRRVVEEGTQRITADTTIGARYTYGPAQP